MMAMTTKSSMSVNAHRRWIDAISFNYLSYNHNESRSNRIEKLGLVLETFGRPNNHLRFRLILVNSPLLWRETFGDL